uniref:Uncharacterized protein n=1 Tax=Ciona savignyi TaxID=51511 RepID=H2ZI34_CIOSA
MQQKLKQSNLDTLTSNFSTTGRNSSVPLGFFRARSQATAAIQDALKKQRSVSKHNTTVDLPTSQRKPEPSPAVDFFNPKKRRSPMGTGSLWSSFVKEETYHCGRCNTSVAIS